MKYIDIEAGCGEFFNNFVAKLINKFKTIKEKNPDVEFQIRGLFNSVTLYINETSTIDSVTNDYHTGLENNHEEYKKSDKYKEEIAQREELTKRLQSEADVLMTKFVDLNKTNIGALLQWLSDFQPYSDNTLVVADNKLIIHTLRICGYESGMNTNDEFDAKDKTKYANYIIGQCLSMLESVGAIHQIIPHFVQEWQNIFENKQEKDDELDR